MNPVGLAIFLLFGDEADPGVAVAIAPQPAAVAAIRGKFASGVWQPGSKKSWEKKKFNLREVFGFFERSFF